MLSADVNQGDLFVAVDPKKHTRTVVRIDEKTEKGWKATDLANPASGQIWMPNPRRLRRRLKQREADRILAILPMLYE